MARDTSLPTLHRLQKRRCRATGRSGAPNTPGLLCNWGRVQAAAAPAPCERTSFACKAAPAHEW
eukprot:11897488-Alexandrium_andersonii.AAC.1